MQTHPGLNGRYVRLLASLKILTVGLFRLPGRFLDGQVFLSGSHVVLTLSLVPEGSGFGLYRKWALERDLGRLPEVASIL